VKGLAKLLSILTLLSLIFAFSSTADPEESKGESATDAGKMAEESATPFAAQRMGSRMGEVVFDHEMHAEELEVECVECHHETNAPPLNYPHKDYFHDLWIDCGSCHREADAPDLEPQSCYDCHDTKLRGIADERLSPKVILHKSCWKCHEVETGTEASESCAVCHSG